MNAWGPHLPGETPIPDRSGLKRQEIKNRKELATAEAENILAAVTKYLAAKPRRSGSLFTYDWSLKVHRDMFGEVWSWAGVIRSTECNIGPLPHLIRDQLAAVFKDLPYWTENPITQACRLHHRTVRVHPFLNGNGRWARMLADIWLRSHDLPIMQWPSAIGEESAIRSEYIAAIKLADSGDLEPLIALHLRHWPGASQSA